MGTPLACLPVVIPLLMAALLAALKPVLARIVQDLLCIATAIATLCISLVLMRQTFANGPIIYWFGGWQPDAAHFPIGINFLIDPIAAGMAALVSLLMLFSFVFSWRYFRTVRSLFNVMMLVFLAAMSGLCLTGDIFNLFVWFELMTAAAVALCGYKSEESTPLQGALNFAVTNTLGAFLTLTGIAFLYGFTGSLNFAGISQALVSHRPDGTFLAIAFVLTTSGFLIKAAAFPFHFWLADAHAVAPTPVCVLFSGVMVQLGLYALMRIYFGVMMPAFAPASSAVRNLLMTVGIASAILGACECFVQRHLKRLLAFSTISHTGIMLIGVALLSQAGVTGALLYIVGHGLLKAELFICAGLVLQKFGSLDEHTLHGAGRKVRWIGILMGIGALGLLALPPFGTFYAETFLDHGLKEVSRDWVMAILVFADALTAAAIWRFSLRVFFGVGKPASTGPSSPSHENRESDCPPERLPIVMWLPAVAALILGIAVGCVPGLGDVVSSRAATLMDSHLYGTVVTQEAAPPALAPGIEPAHAYWPSITATLLAAGIVACTMNRRTNSFVRAVFKVWSPFHYFQSGRVTDYVAWLVLGVAACGAGLILQLR